jgi:antitoxin component YwqK of YwqJK toxin-antitoxin module
MKKYSKCSYYRILPFYFLTILCLLPLFGTSQNYQIIPIDENYGKTKIPLQIIEDINNNLYILTRQDGYGYIITKINKNAEKEWEEGIEGGYVSINKILLDNKGNVLVYGSHDSPMTIKKKKYYWRGENVVFLAKYNPNGNIEWVKRSKGPGACYDNGLYIDHLDNIYIAGDFLDDVRFDGFELKDNNSVGGSFFLGKYSEDGKMEWIKTVKEINPEKMKAIGIDEAFNYYLAGSFLNKYDSDGNLLWKRCSKASINEIDFDKYKNIYVTGTFTSLGIFDSTIVNSHGYHDIFTAKYSADGKLQWINSGGGKSEDNGISIMIDNSQNVYVVCMILGKAAFGNTLVESVLKNKKEYCLIKYDRTGNLAGVIPSWSFDELYGERIFFCNKNVYVFGKKNNSKNYSLIKYDPTKLNFSLNPVPDSLLSNLFPKLSDNQIICSDIHDCYSGYCSEYFQKQLRIKKYFSEGKPDGPQLIFSSKGDTAELENYKNGILNGRCKYKPLDNIVQNKWSYLISIQGNEPSPSQIEGQYKDGIRYGEWKEWYENGKLKGKYIYSPEDTSVKCTVWYENGNISCKGNLKKASYKVGVWEFWYDNGQKMMDVEFIKLVPMSFSWPFDEASNHKLINFWEKDGTQSIKEGNGKMIYKTHNDDITYTNEYKNGLADGIWTCTASDNLKSDSYYCYYKEYKNGVLHGRSFINYCGGKILRDQYFNNGKIIEK